MQNDHIPLINKALVEMLCDNEHIRKRIEQAYKKLLSGYKLHQVECQSGNRMADMIYNTQKELVGISSIGYAPSEAATRIIIETLSRYGDLPIYIELAVWNDGPYSKLSYPDVIIVTIASIIYGSGMHAKHLDDFYRRTDFYFDFKQDDINTIIGHINSLQINIDSHIEKSILKEARLSRKSKMQKNKFAQSKAKS